MALLGEGDIVVGGETVAEERYIAPTVIDNVSLEHPVMADEVFGPILPVLEYEELAKAISIVNDQPKPLALYFFSENRQKQRKVLESTASEGGCINDTVAHFSHSLLPFGGVGASGFGSYHGKASFDAFSHEKSILRKSTLFDIALRYPPYAGKLKLVKRLLK